jgi:Holliday junction resolvase RusA-like endonuclease
MSRGKFAHAYYPKSYKDWKLSFAAKVIGPPSPMDGPLVMSIENVISKPRTSKLTHPVGDVDNYAKSVMDALTELAFWNDDKQVISLHVTKRFAVSSETPHVLIEITHA